MKSLFRTKTIVFLLILLNPIHILAATLVEEVDLDIAIRSHWLAATPGKMPTGTQHLAFKSPAAQTDVGYTVYLPPGYSDTGTTTYPVVYWLHGAGGNEIKEMKWLAPLAEKAIKLGQIPPIIIVFPTAGGFTLWCNTFDQKLLAETVFINELFPLIESKFHAIKNRSSRFLEGFSMGGFGSARFLFKYPQTFISAVTYGSAYSTVDTIADKSEFKQVFGRDIDYFLQNDPATQAATYSSGASAIRYPVKIRVVIGTDDPNLEGNRSFRDQLITLGINPDYQELANYKHDAEPYYNAVGIEGFNFHF